MRAANRDAKHIRTTVSYIRKISEAAGFVTAGDITADGVNGFAAELREAGRSARTVQAFLTAMKGFARWLTAHGKLPSDPLASVQKPNPRADRRVERRMLLPEEWQWLWPTILANGVERYGMATGERMLLYATAIQTGLRHKELRSLARGRLFLHAEPPYLVCKAGSTKNKRDARQYVEPDLARRLRERVATKAPTAPVFALPDRHDVAAMLREDMADARREWLTAADHDPDEQARRTESDFLRDVNHEGEVLDFHALRHTCGAWLALEGAHPKTVQTIMRHSSISLTMDVYGHLFPGQEAEAVARLGGLLAAPSEALRATGTDGQVAGQEEAQRTARDAEYCERLQRGATRGRR